MRRLRPARSVKTTVITLPSSRPIVFQRSSSSVPPLRTSPSGSKMRVASSKRIPCFLTLAWFLSSCHSNFVPGFGTLLGLVPTPVEVSFLGHSTATPCRVRSHPSTLASRLQGSLSVCVEVRSRAAFFSPDVPRVRPHRVMRSDCGTLRCGANLRQSRMVSGATPPPGSWCGTCNVQDQHPSPRSRPTQPMRVIGDLGGSGRTCGRTATTRSGS